MTPESLLAKIVGYSFSFLLLQNATRVQLAIAYFTYPSLIFVAFRTSVQCSCENPANFSFSIFLSILPSLVGLSFLCLHPRH